MSVSIELNGIAELKAQLLKLPDDLADEGADIVRDTANGAAADIALEYGEHVVTGHLADNLVVQHSESSSRFAAVSRVLSTSPHAYIFENGTQLRYTKAGTARGAMPPFRVFIPISMRARKAMVEKLIGLVRRQGLKVNGNA